MRRETMAVLAALAAGCGGSGDGDDDVPDATVASMCGDDICNGDETTGTCPGDCPCSPQPDDSCTGENICVGDSCVSAFGRNYRIIIYNGTMTTTDELGETWDAAGGLPDPFVVIALNGTPLSMSTAVQDTLTPVWNQYVDSVIPAGSTFSIAVYDEDIASDDFMFGCSGFPLTADYLRAGGVQCSGQAPLAAANVNVYFDRL